MTEVSKLLEAANRGDTQAAADLLPLVYDELRRLAAVKVAGEKPGETLNATALVHEAWLKLADASVEWQDRTHYFRAAATAMRRILVDRARAKKTGKRDGGAHPDHQLLALDDALERLTLQKPDHARFIELRFFVGLTADEAASALGISPASGDRMWRYAKAWLKVEMKVD